MPSVIGGIKSSAGVRFFCYLLGFSLHIRGEAHFFATDPFMNGLGSKLNNALGGLYVSSSVTRWFMV